MGGIDRGDQVSQGWGALIGGDQVSQGWGALIGVIRRARDGGH